MVETTNAVGGRSPPALSALPPDILAEGFQPIGQKGLRLASSTAKADLFFISTAGLSAARREPSVKIDMEMKRIFFIAFAWWWTP
jgi:hypothetical protein